MARFTRYFPAIVVPVRSRPNTTRWRLAAFDMGPLRSEGTRPGAKISNDISAAGLGAQIAYMGSHAEAHGDRGPRDDGDLRTPRLRRRRRGCERGRRRERR